MLNGLDQVSVVIPVLNDWSPLKALLRALTPFEELEIVVVDGGSDEVDTARTSASSWLEKHVLHTTASIEK